MSVSETKGGVGKRERERERETEEGGSSEREKERGREKGARFSGLSGRGSVSPILPAGSGLCQSVRLSAAGRGPTAVDFLACEFLR